MPWFSVRYCLASRRSFGWSTDRARNEKLSTGASHSAMSCRIQAAVLEALRRERGFGAIGGIAGLQGLDELIVQSGVKIDTVRICVWLVVLTCCCFICLWHFG